MSEAALEVENLVKVYHQRRQPPVRAVDGMSFGVARGTIFGLLGPNGAGKTTILKRAVMGYLREEARQGRTIMLTTQILSEAEELCDDILIMNKGRQVARGDLHALKLLSEGVYEVAITFERLPETIEAEIARLAPLRMKINQNTVELTLKAEEARVLELVSELARNRRVLRVEVSGASLEDIFVELTQEK